MDRWFGAIGKLGDRFVGQLVGAVAERFTGEQVEITHDGRPVRFTLAGVKARAGDKGSDVAFSLKDVEWADNHLGAVEGMAHRARMRPGVPTAVVKVDDVDLTVTATAEALLASLGPGPDSGWTIEVLPDGRAAIRHARTRRMSGEVELAVVDGAVRADLRAIRIGSRRIAAPRWFRFSRMLPPPELPGGAQLRTLDYADGEVRIELSVPGFTRDLDLRPLRRALTGIDINLPIPV